MYNECNTCILSMYNKNPYKGSENSIFKLLKFKDEELSKIVENVYVFLKVTKQFVDTSLRIDDTI